MKDNREIDYVFRNIYPELSIPMNNDLSFGNIYANHPKWTMCLGKYKIIFRYFYKYCVFDF